MDTTAYRLLRLFRLYPEYFNYYISKYYLFSREDIRKYQHKLCWVGLSSNIFLDWDEELLLEFENLWDREGLTFYIFGLKGLSNPLLVKKYLDKDLLIYALLDVNENIEWSEEMAIEYGFEHSFINEKISSLFKWNLEKIEKAIYRNQEVIISDDSLLDMISDAVNVEWSDELIDKYIDQISFSSKVPFLYKRVNAGGYPWQYKYEITITATPKEIEEIASLLEKYGDKLIPLFEEYKENEYPSFYSVCQEKDYFLFDNPLGKGIDFTFNTIEKRKILDDAITAFYEEI